MHITVLRLKKAGLRAWHPVVQDLLFSKHKLHCLSFSESTVISRSEPCFSYVSTFSLTIEMSDLVYRQHCSCLRLSTQCSCVCSLLEKDFLSRGWNISAYTGAPRWPSVWADLKNNGPFFKTACFQWSNSLPTWPLFHSQFWYAAGWCWTNWLAATSAWCGSHWECMDWGKENHTGYLECPSYEE